METFEIDVSGEDIFGKDYTICVANKNGIIKGFKFNPGLVSILRSRQGQGIYKNYKKSDRGRAFFKVRLYSIIVYYLFNSIKTNKDISLKICRDFSGRETDIKNNLIYLLEKILDYKIDGRFDFAKLDKESNAHNYAYLMRRDTKNKMDCYVRISLDDIEKFLKK